MLMGVLLVCLFIGLIFLLDKKPPGLPPGPWGLPVIGSPSVQGILKLEDIRNFTKKYGDIFSIRVGSRIMVFMSNFDTIKTAFNKPELQGRPDMFTFKVFTYNQNLGLAASYNEVWTTGRRFALRHLRDLGLGKTRIQESIQNEAAELVSLLEVQANKPIELTWEVNVAVLNVIWQLVANRRYGIEDQKMQEFSSMINDNFDILQGPITLLNVMPWLVDVLPDSVKNKFMKVNTVVERRDKLFAFLKEAIKEHVETFDRNNLRDLIDYYLLEMENEKDNPDTIFRSDYMNLLSSISDLFVAGSETTSSTLRWMALCMAKFPEEQQKVHKLLDEVVPHDRLPALEDRTNLVYLDAVLMEVLRVSSFVPQGVPHTASTDTTVDGYQIPKDTFVMACTEICHRNPKYFERPDDFYPGHFLDENQKLLTKKDGFCPFSIGRRQCLGENLAKVELFLFSAAILQRFKISPAPGTVLKMDTDDTKPLFNFAQPFKVVLTPRF